MIDTLDARIGAYARRTHYMGMLRVTVGDRIVYRRSDGMADIAAGVPFGEDTMFSFYSLSKPFCPSAS